MRLRNKTKNICANVLACAVLFSCVPAYCAGGGVILKETYNSYVTNRKPKTGIYTGKNIHILERTPGSDKAVSVELDDGYAEAVFDMSLSADSFCASADVKLDDSVNFSVSVIDGSDNIREFYYTDEKGAGYAYNGYKVSGTGRGGSFGRVSVVYNGVKKSYDLYVNKKRVLSNWLIRGTQISQPKKLVLAFESESDGKTVFIDNVIISDGATYVNPDKVSKEAYNPEEIQFTPDYDEDKAENVYANTNFNINMEGIKTYPKDNKIEIIKDKTENNGYLKLSREGKDDCFINIPITPQSSHIVMQFDMRYAGTCYNGFVSLKDENTKSARLLNFSDGVLTTAESKIAVGKISKKEWLNVAIAYNCRGGKYDVYIDGKLAASKQQPKESGLTGLSLITIYCMTGTGSASLMIDNLRVYDGKEPKEKIGGSSDEKKSRVDYSDEAKKLLGNAVALHKDSQYAFYGGDKHLLAKKPVTENGELMLSAEDTEKVSGVKPSGEKDFFGVTEIFKNVLDKEIYKGERGLYIIGDYIPELTEAQAVTVNDYMLYNLPGKDDILALFNEKQQKHPRVLADAETFSRIENTWQTDPYLYKWGKNVIALANSYEYNDPVTYSMPDGLRLTSTCRVVLRRAKNLGLAYRLTGEKKYIDRLWKELEAAMAFPDWNPKHPLDVSEMSMAFAVAYDWCYDVWTDEQKAKMEDKLYNYGINVYNDAYYGGTLSWAVVEENNRGAVNNSGCAVAAMAIFESNPELCADFIANASRGMTFPMRCFFPSGSWNEGTGYWSYALQYITYFLSTLDSVFDTDFNLSSAYGFKDTAYFSIFSSGAGNISDNYHDAANGSVSMSSPIYWLAANTGCPDTARVMLEKCAADGGAEEMLWYDTAAAQMPFELSRDILFDGKDQYFSMRGSWNDDSSAVLMGHAGEGWGGLISHNHLDSGTFVLDMEGERWAEDIGSQNYNTPGMGDPYNKYLYYRLSPQGHNCLLINPGMENIQTLDAFCPAERYEFKEKGAYVVMNMSEAYSENAKSAKRGYRLDDDRRSAVIRDEAVLKKESDVYWVCQTKADIEVIDNTTAILTKNGKKVKLSFITNAKEYTLTAEEAKPIPGTADFSDQTPNDGFKKIQLKMKANGSFFVQAKFIPAGDMNENVPQQNIKLVDWTAPDGELDSVPHLNSIEVDGAPLLGFSPYTTLYECAVDSSGKLPEITASADDSVSVEIVRNDGNTEITAKNKNGVMYRKYVVTYTELLRLPDISGKKRLPVYGAVASANPEKENMYYNALDGNLETRWTSLGEGNWLVVDLGAVCAVDAVGVAVWNGSRIYRYDIQASDDLNDWKTVAAGVTNSGFSDGVEVTEFERINTRYLRLYCYGNNVNAYNNFIEFAPLQN